MDELQEMREQMASLKEKLNKQEIINKKLISNIRKAIITEKLGVWTIAITITFPLSLMWVFTFLANRDIEDILWKIFLTLLGLGVVINISIPIFMVKIKDLRSGNMLKVARQMQQAKKYKQKRFAPTNGCLGALLMIYMYFNYPLSSHPHAAIYIIGAAIAVIISFFPKHRTLKAWEEFIRQAEEISDLDEEKADDKK